MVEKQLYVFSFPKLIGGQLHGKSNCDFFDSTFDKSIFNEDILEQ